MNQEQPVMKTKHPYQPDHAISPGDTLLETIAELDLTRKELALRMGCPLETIHQIIEGAAPIMPETALQLEKATGVPASFWHQAESDYRQALARMTEKEEHEARRA